MRNEEVYHLYTAACSVGLLNENIFKEAIGRNNPATKSTFDSKNNIEALEIALREQTNAARKLYTSGITLLAALNRINHDTTNDNQETE